MKDTTKVIYTVVIEEKKEAQSVHHQIMYLILLKNKLFHQQEIARIPSLVIVCSVGK